ncbi:MAG: ATP-binding protein, partial [Chlamydiota bacterium]
MSKTEKFFNTVGAINPQKHYFIPHRLDWNQLSNFIKKEYYFVLHAPRQSGKTTAIIEFVKYLNQKGNYRALYLSIESSRKTTNDILHAVQVILKQFKDKIKIFIPQESTALLYLEKIIKEKNYDETGIYDFLRFWAEEDKNKPLIIFFDEFDVLAGDPLVTLLSQIRTGYTDRPEHFPQTICLVGVRDLRDYKIKTSEEKELSIL